jgi:N-acetyl-anhydromuramyl-L-alanine amidase AmpD
VVLWTDPGGYDGYRVERRFAPLGESSWEAMVKSGKAPDTPNRYGMRRAGLSAEQTERVRGGGWELEELQGVVDQFVLHYDVCGTSRRCFRVLHDVRGLSVHFLLDIDGTIYQTIDVKERAWHATTSNDRSVGIEIANMGAYAAGERSPLAEWYAKDDRGRTVITIPSSMGDGGVRTPGFVGRPARDEPVVGEIQGVERTMYDLTPQQYDSLTRLTATLCTVLPRIRCDYPRDAEGRLVTSKLPDEELAAFSGVLGHYHIQANKADPGPALQWERVIGRARRLMPAGVRAPAPSQPPATPAGGS